MFGIYKYDNGLQFLGVVARTYEDAEKYLKNKYTRETTVWTGERDENNCPIYKKVLAPWYREGIFRILPLEVVEN